MWLLKAATVLFIIQLVNSITEINNPQHNSLDHVTHTEYNLFPNVNATEIIQNITHSGSLSALHLDQLLENTRKIFFDKYGLTNSSMQFFENLAGAFLQTQINYHNVDSRTIKKREIFGVNGALFGVQNPIFNLDRVIDNARKLFNSYGIRATDILRIQKWFSIQNIGNKFLLLQRSLSLLLKILKFTHQCLSSVVIFNPKDNFSILAFLFPDILANRPLRPSKNIEINISKNILLPKHSAKEWHKVDLQYGLPKLPSSEAYGLPTQVHKNSTFKELNLHQEYGLPEKGKSNVFSTLSQSQEYGIPPNKKETVSFKEGYTLPENERKEMFSSLEKNAKGTLTDLTYGLPLPDLKKDHAFKSEIQSYELPSPKNKQNFLLEKEYGFPLVDRSPNKFQNALPQLPHEEFNNAIKTNADDEDHIILYQTPSVFEEEHVKLDDISYGLPRYMQQFKNLHTEVSQQNLKKDKSGLPDQKKTQNFEELPHFEKQSHFEIYVPNEDEEVSDVLNYFHFGDRIRNVNDDSEEDHRTTKKNFGVEYMHLGQLPLDKHQLFDSEGTTSLRNSYGDPLDFV